MIKHEFFVDILLPLNLWSTYTYKVPEALVNQAMIGKRAIVQFGKSKLYSGIIISIHQDKPIDFEPKAIEEIVDAECIIHPIQIQFWKWLAEYYMCPLGNVFFAALPSGLKLSSETSLVFNEHTDYTQVELTESEYLIAEALSIQRELAAKDIQNILGKKSVFHIIKGLLIKKIAHLQEDIHEKYAPKLVSFVKLHPRMNNKGVMKDVFEQLEKKSVKQLQLLQAYYVLQKEFDFIQKSELIIKSQSTAAQLEALVKKEVFIEEKMPISRLKKYHSDIDAVIELSDAQQRALSEIEQAHATASTALLYGLTGSGKTEIYIKLIESYLAAQKKVLLLLPEIGLTTQIVERLERFFGNDIIVYHSRFNESERVEIWNRVNEGQFKIILGARSAIFLPFEKIDLIIVDEEHDSSYKQADPDPRYNARDAALYYAALMKAKVLLGSATPSAETYFNAMTKKYGYIELTERFGPSVLPEIEIVDIKKAEHQKAMQDSFSKHLIRQIQEALDLQQQVILFQNRRGYAPYIECKVCAWTPFCKYCDVGMTYHKAANHLVCHYCNYKAKMPTVCSACNSSYLTVKGLGTEKVEDEVKLLFPDARIERMDFDTTRSKDAHSKLFKKFEDKELDILIGTQMVTKGLDFNHVSLVGVINADNLLFMPDYRINERAFQTLCQVSGRAGRKAVKGKVIIQTSHPNHPILSAVVSNNTLGFLQAELEERKKFLYPPFIRMIKITLKLKEEKSIEELSREYCSELKAIFPENIIGPVKPLIGRIQNMYIREVIFKFPRDHSYLQHKKVLLEFIQAKGFEQKYRNMRMIVNVDV